MRTGTAAAVIFLAVLTACGGGDGGSLARGDGITVTVEDFRAEFDQLTPEGQVMVLERGGRMALVTLLVNRGMLLAEAEAAPPEGLQEWLDLSSRAWLSTMWITAQFDSLNAEGLDTLWIDSLLSTGIEITAVLLDDSARAESLRREWETEGPSEPSEGMALAPWTLDGSSYIELDGDLFRFLGGDPSFARVALPMAGAGFVVRPLFGEWILFRLDAFPMESPPLDPAAASQGYVFARLGARNEVSVLSAPVAQLAHHLTPSGGRYLVTDEERIDRSTVLATYPGGVVTAGQIVDLFRMITPESFFDGIPRELAPLSPPMPMIDPAIDLWMFVDNVGTVASQAALGAATGLVFPLEEAELTTTEHLLRVAALESAAALDTADALAFFEEHREEYALPELRSVLLAYVPADWLPEGQPSSFDDFERYYSTTDSLGRMLPTPPRPLEVYGPLGPAIFAAEPDAFTGPVEVPDTDLRAWFQVAEIVPPGTASPEDILPLLLRDCRTSTIASNLEAYLGELRARYDVEIDSAAVEQVDPWSSTY